MTSEWQSYQLDELCDFTNGFAFKSTDYVDKSEDTIEVFRMGYISRGGGYKEDSTPVFVPKKYTKDLNKYLLKSGDVVIAMTDMKDKVAILGNTAQIRHENRFVLNQRVGCLRVKERELLCHNFLYFYSNSAPHINYLRSRANSGVQVNLSTSAIKESTLLIPPIAEQRQISAILMALDDRITLLRDTNSTLKAIAQTLFKSWFIDFDPVRAKSQGSLPEGIDAEIAAMFPDTFEETELGLVPKGWQVTSVCDVAEVVKGKSYSSKDLAVEHTTALVTLKSFERGGGFRMDGFKPYTGAYKPSQVVNAGDLIVAYTDVTQAAELIGKPAIVVSVDEYDTLVASLDVGIVRPDLSKCGRQFLYGLFRTDMFQSHTFAHTSGTTVLHLSRDGVGSYKFALPPIELGRKFEEIASVIAERNQINADEIRTLDALRNNLLPRLISGQLRIDDAEAELEKAIA